MSAPDKWLYRDSYTDVKPSRQNYDSYFAQHHIYPPLKNKAFIWDSPRPDTAYSRKDLDHIQPSFFFGSFNPLSTVAWLPVLPNEINKRQDKDHIQESFFFNSYKSIKPIAWLTVQEEINVKSYRQDEYQSFFMNIKTIPIVRTEWIEQKETDNVWIKIKETF